MPLKWKPDKAPGKKREQKQRLARQQKRKDFAKNMERAVELCREFCNGTKDFDTMHPIADLDMTFVQWAYSTYRHCKFDEPKSQQFKDMSETWNEILVTAAACKKATDARWYAVRKVRRDRAIAKFRADRTQSYIEKAQRFGAVMQAKMQERKL